MGLKHIKARHWGLALGALVATAVIVLVPVFTGGERAPGPRKEVLMRQSNTLVLYYSRSGTTAKLAEAIARGTGADVERLTDTVDRAGFFGFLRSIRDAARQSSSTLNPLAVDPTAYELVIIGTPDWGKSVAAPVRTFLKAHHGKLPKVAFFLTDGLTDHSLVFGDMAALVGAQPVATLGIPHEEVTQDRYLEKAEAFVKSLPATRPLGVVRLTEPAEARF